MKVTLELPDDWAASLPQKEEELAEVVAAGLRSRQSRARREVDHLSDVLDALASLPTPEEVLALRPSPALSERIDALLEKRRAGSMTPDEEAEWLEIMRVEHLVRIAKARAAAKVKAAGSGE